MPRSKVLIPAASLAAACLQTRVQPLRHGVCPPLPSDDEFARQRIDPQFNHVIERV
jgi:hypothetical protein